MESTMLKRQELDDDVLNESSNCRSPEKAMEEIHKQDTHELYCPKCTCKITKTAQLFEKGDEFSQDNQKPFLLWVPIFTPFKFLSSSPTGSVEINSSKPNYSGTVDNISSIPNSNGNMLRMPTIFRKYEENYVANKDKDKNAGHQSSTSASGSVDNNSSNPSPSRIGKMLRWPTIFRKYEENYVANRDKDKNAGHQRSTSASESEKHEKANTTYKAGWKFHRWY